MSTKESVPRKQVGPMKQVSADKNTGHGTVDKLHIEHS